MDLVERVRRAWSVVSEVPDAFLPGTTRVVAIPASRIAPPGWCGVVALGDACLIVTPDEDTATRIGDFVQAVPAGRVPDIEWSQIGARDVLGPAALYFTLTHPRIPTAGITVERVAAGGRQVVELIGRASPDEAQEADVEEAMVTFAAMVAGEAAAVVGYRIWPGSIAHFSALTDPAHRRHGYGQAAAREAVAHALAAGLLPQWRARPLASQQFAQTLGMQKVGTQASIRIAS